MSLPDPGYVAFLQSPALYAIAAGAAAATFGTLAHDMIINSGIALASDAATEAALQAAFLSGPIVRDKHIVSGRRRDLIGKLVTLTNVRLGYGGGLNVFVVKVEEAPNGNSSTLYVLRRMT